ncbi:hypothetical protein DdX_00307 [Ditylenchus destructor]|uniref:Uncharacterized protein n=1 Tax=Ditylenchus destructor TaxID=166010 RepID=A0AAD4RD58_9BILA|nr:hypothetical protein DdX_00307 [Ditylenchus destructor]
MKSLANQHRIRSDTLGNEGFVAIMEKEVLSFMTSVHSDYENIVQELETKKAELEKKTSEANLLQQKCLQISEEFNKRVHNWEEQLEQYERTAEDNNQMCLEVELLRHKHQALHDQKGAVVRELACTQADLARYKKEHRILSSQVTHLLYAISKRDSLEGQNSVIQVDPATEQYVFNDIHQLQQKNIELSGRLFVELHRQHDDIDSETNPKSSNEVRLSELLVQAQTFIEKTVKQRDNYKLLYQQAISQLTNQDIHTKHIQELGVRVEEKTKEIERQTKKIDAQSQHIQGQTEKIRSFEKQIGAKVQNMKEQSTLITQQKMQMDQQTKQINQQTSQLQFLMQQVKSQDVNLQRQENEIRLLTEKLNEQNDQINEQLQKIQYQREQLTKYANIMSKQATKFAILDNEQFLAPQKYISEDDFLSPAAEIENTFIQVKKKLKYHPYNCEVVAVKDVPFYLMPNEELEENLENIF